MSSKFFILYDSRAKLMDTSEATVLVCANSEKEAREDGKDFKNYDAIWYEYDCKGKELVNERARWDLPPAGGGK